MTNGPAIVVGGTGMLAGVVRGLRLDGWAVTVVSRGEPGFRQFADDPGVRHLAVDYHGSAAFAAALRRCMRDGGPIRLAVAWIHSPATQAVQELESALDETGEPARIVHVLGSAAVPPEQWSSRGDGPGGIVHQQVRLGFVIEGASSRWLTHEEICDGVLAAIRTGASESVVGALQPWSRRP